MNTTRRISVIILALTISLSMPTQSADAGLFGKIVSGVKSIVSAPVKAVGWLVGQGVNSAVDPAMDNAFGRLRETSDHALDRMDSISGARVAELSQLAKDSINQLDEVSKNRLNQLDQIMATRLDQVDTILDSKLDRVESLADHVLDREAEILDKALTETETLVDRSLDRLQEIETDAFDRVDAALQDQVPFAAGEVAQTIEWTAAVIVFLVVLVGFGGVSLIRRATSDESEGTILQRLKANLRFVPRTLLTVGVPMLFLFAVIQLGYMGYCAKVDRDRFTRLDSAAELLEQVGDYRAAHKFRRRSFALGGSEDRHYFVVRDEWLADFWQRRVGQDLTELTGRLSQLLTDKTYAPHADEDAEILAASIYLQSTTPNVSDTISDEILAQIEAYKSTHLANTADSPTLGKLVYMAEARLLLNQLEKPVVERLESSLKATDAMLAHESYQKYATGLLLRARLQTYLLELKIDTFTSDALDEGAVIAMEESKAIAEDVNAALVIDPNLVRFIRFRSLSLDDVDASTASKLVQLQAVAAAERPKQDALLKDINGALEKLEIELKETIRPLLRDEKLVQAKVERQLARAIRAGVGESVLAEQITRARESRGKGAAASELFPLYQNVINSAIGIGKLHTAEIYLNEIQTAFIEKSPNALSDEQKKFVTDTIGVLRKERLADVMFDVI